ncbi:uncharacterized protein BDR25DRAFT_309217 [Lindgomyces ingoldianus]|uniref:Uncharacterized protein n=1 Tax=Lindgomyces ingoldianus TaxID=673940 RepID=A0ACB6RCF5_9PLEO|nr:uncharacterized protein BDR25DRAFT_309217 [Lindgomyces ingoldianus]KAF2476866.1 hypothetical protein BDR25DRAFT_309217 [Lindgomyces ingoldianus]
MRDDGGFFSCYMGQQIISTHLGCAHGLSNHQYGWRCSKSLQSMKDQADTDQEVNNSNVYTNGDYSSGANGESSRKRPPGDDDNNNDDRPPGKRRKVTNIYKEPDTRLLACPFAKKDPLRHRKCFKYVLQDIARLKQHLMRVHEYPYTARDVPRYSLLKTSETAIFANNPNVQSNHLGAGARRNGSFMSPRKGADVPIDLSVEDLQEFGECNDVIDLHISLDTVR